MYSFNTTLLRLLPCLIVCLLGACKSSPDAPSSLAHKTSISNSTTTETDESQTDSSSEGGSDDTGKSESDIPKEKSSPNPAPASNSTTQDDALETGGGDDASKGSEDTLQKKKSSETDGNTGKSELDIPKKESSTTPALASNSTTKDDTLENGSVGDASKGSEDTLQKKKSNETDGNTGKSELDILEEKSSPNPAPASNSTTKDDTGGSNPGSSPEDEILILSSDLSMEDAWNQVIKLIPDENDKKSFEELFTDSSAQYKCAFLETLFAKEGEDKCIYTVRGKKYMAKECVIQTIVALLRDDKNVPIEFTHFVSSPAILNKKIVEKAKSSIRDEVLQKLKKKKNKKYKLSEEEKKKCEENSVTGEEIAQNIIKNPGIELGYAEMVRIGEVTVKEFNIGLMSIQLGTALGNAFEEFQKDFLKKLRK